MLMINTTAQHKVIELDDGIFAVAFSERNKPHIMNIVAMFYIKSRANEYCDYLNNENWSKEYTKHEQQLEQKEEEEEITEMVEQEINDDEEEKCISERGVKKRLTRKQIKILEFLAENSTDNRIKISLGQIGKFLNIPSNTVFTSLSSLSKKNRIKVVEKGNRRTPQTLEILSEVYANDA